MEINTFHNIQLPDLTLLTTSGDFCGYYLWDIILLLL